MLESGQRMGHFPSGFLLEHGREWEAQPLPRHYARQANQLCYMNATQLVTENPRLTYVEGYACHGGLFPLGHAWAVTKDCKVVDPTWDYPGESTYFGIAFRTAFVLEVVSSTRLYGLFETPGFWLTFADANPDRLTRSLQTGFQ
jgi:hypothetical protein